MPRLARISLTALCLLCTAFEWPGRVDRLARELERGDLDARKAAARQLGQYPEAQSEGPLLLALEDDDPGVRIEAAQAAARAGIRKAVTIVREWLRDEDPGLRRAAVLTLGALGARQLEPELVRALGDGSPEVRVAAVQALQALGSSEGASALLGRLVDDDPAVRAAAIVALGELGSELAVMPLLGQLTDSSPELATRAAQAIAAIGDVRAAPALASALQQGSPQARAAAAQALMRLRAVSAVPALIAATQDGESVVAKAAIAALGQIDDERARAALLERLSSPLLGGAASEALVEQAKRMHAQEALATEATQQRALTPLLEQLLAQATIDEPAATSTAILALRTLETIGRWAPIDSVVEPMTGLLRDGPEPLRAAALDALAQCESEPARLALLEQFSRNEESAPPFDRLLKALDRQLARGEPDGRAADPLLDRLARVEPEHVPALLGLVGLTGASRAHTAIQPLLQATSAAVRAAAAAALGAIDTPNPSALLPLLTDEDAHTRISAAIALRRSGDAATARKVLEMLASGSASSSDASDPHALLTALGGMLGRLHRAGTLPADVSDGAFAQLSALIRGHDTALSDRALDALATWGPKRAIAFLGQRLRTPSSRARALVAAAIGRLPHPDTRQLLRYVLDQGGTRAAVAAAGALAELGDARDAGALLRAAHRKPWPLPLAATHALARLAMRGEIKPHFAQRELCKLGASREPYVRANVAAALSSLGLGACADDGPDPIAWLRDGRSAAVRFSAALWTRTALARNRLEQASAERALRRCAERDLDPEVRDVCAGGLWGKPTRDAGPASHAVVRVTAVSAEPESHAAGTRDSLVALRMPSGAVLLGYTDHNGLLTVHTPPGSLRLESPAAAALEDAARSAAPMDDAAEPAP